MEAYLLLRSLRTLGVRLRKQSRTATLLARWLHSLTLPQGEVEPEDAPFAGGKVISITYHSSLQPRSDPSPRGEDPSFNPTTQMPGGHTPTFAFQTTSPEYATWIPHLTSYFTPATSLGGVESLLNTAARAIRQRTSASCASVWAWSTSRISGPISGPRSKRCSRASRSDSSSSKRSSSNEKATSSSVLIERVARRVACVCAFLRERAVVVHASENRF